MSVLINSWYFDFDRMEARRDPSWVHYDPKGRTKMGFDVHGGVIKRFSFEKGWIPFFSYHEEKFNEEVAKKYLDWKFEKEVLGSLPADGSPVS